MEQVTLSRLITKLESGSREKGGSVNSGVISIGGTHLSNNGGFKWKKKEYISNSFFSKMRSGKIRKNDILIVKDGATTGKVSFVDDSFPYHEAAINEHVFRVEINQSHANPRYVFHFLFSPKGQEQILNDFRGATVGGISRGFIEKVEIPLPNIEIQDKIVAILDKAKNLIEKRQQTIKMYNELLRAIFLDMFGDPIMNPMKWESDEISSYTDCIVPGRDKPKSFTGNIPWFTTDDLIHNSFVLSSKKKLGLSEFEIKQVNAKIIPIGSVIMTCVGDLGILSINKEPCVVNQQLHTYQCKSTINNIFLMMQLTFLKKYLYNVASITTVPYMNKTTCNTLPIIVPNIELQNKFSDFFVKIEKLKKNISQSKTQFENLLKGLSQNAFNGELEFNTAVDLEVLLENDYTYFKDNADKKAMQLLLDRLDKNELNKNKFYEQDLYDKAKSFVFELLKEDIIKQVFDKKTKRVKLKV